MRRQDRPLTHDWIWHAIDTLAKRRGLSPSALAKIAGLDPTTFNRSKRITPEGRPRWPSTESIAKVLDATGTTLDEFATIELADALEVFFDETEEGEISGVPVVGQILDGVVHGWDPALDIRLAAGGSAVPFVRRRRFAMAVADSSLEPAYSCGNTLVVSEAAEPRPGDRVMIKPAGTPVAPRLLVSANDARIEISAFGDTAVRSMRRDEVEWMARIVLVRQ